MIFLLKVMHAYPADYTIHYYYLPQMLPVELIPPPTTLGWGVLRVTLYDVASVPIAERLIYREPGVSQYIYS